MEDRSEPIRAALRRYSKARDPLEKLRALATVQREAPAALAATVRDCRGHGIGWRSIGAVLGLSRTSMYEQTRAGAVQVGPDHEHEEMTA